MHFKNLMNRVNIRGRILFLLLAGIILFSGIDLFVTRLFSQSLIENYLYNYLEVAQQEMGNSIGLTIDEVNMLSVRLLTNQDIFDLMGSTGMKYEEKERKLQAVADNLVLNKTIVGEIYLVTHKGEVYSFLNTDNSIQIPDEVSLNRIKTAGTSMVWGDIKKDAKNNAYILLIKRYRNFNTGQDLGYLFIYIRESALYDVYKSIISSWGYSFLMSGDNHIISHPDKSKVGNIIYDTSIFQTDGTFHHSIIDFNSKPTIMAISSFDDSLRNIGIDWKIISVIQEDKLFEAVIKIDKYVFVIAFMMSIIAIFLSIKLSSTIISSITLLKSKLKRFGKDVNIEPLLASGPRNEIWELEKSYNEMVTRISDLIEKNNEEKEKQKEMELTALQAQINPHFLYNTLDTIAWMAKLNKQQDIEKLVLALGRFFRNSLHKGDKYIMVREEIDILRSFATIELTRAPGQFDIDFCIQEEILDCLMLKLTLQPLVENAIKHGVSTKPDKGHIEVKGYMEGNDLLFEVSDDGIGFDLESYASDNPMDSFKKSGYGFRNVDERIRLEYGEKYGLKVLSEKNRGTTVKVRIHKS